MFPSIFYSDKQKTLDELCNDMTYEEKQKIKKHPFDDLWKDLFNHTSPVKTVSWESKYSGSICTPEGKKVGITKKLIADGILIKEKHELLAENERLKTKIKQIEEMRHQIEKIIHEETYGDMPGLISIDDCYKDNDDFAIRIEI